MAKGAGKSAVEELECQGVSPVNTDDLESASLRAERRVLEIQTKLHRWAGDDPHHRFDDLYNLVADPAFLLVAWDRVVQASLKLVLEPIFEADFLPCSYGSARCAGPTTRWPRCVSTRCTPMSGSWRVTSKPASTRSRTPPSWTGCVDVSGTDVSWLW